MGAVQTLPATGHACAVNYPMSQPFSRKFLSGSPAAYRQWRENKLIGCSQTAAGRCIDIADPWSLTADEIRQLADSIKHHNFVLYRYDPHRYGSWEPVRALCAQMGLRTTVDNPLSDENGVSTLYDRTGETDFHDRRYIPYSSRPLNWHTDGYYSEGSGTIRSFVLHCERAASLGGENNLLDHEMAYLRLRDRHPALAEALTSPDIMTIPENLQGDVRIRKRFRGTVFSVDRDTGCLYMRYTQRRHNIHWRDDPRVSMALNVLDDLLNTGFPEKLTVRLSPGQGMLCNNILHCRAAYADRAGAGPDTGRLFYRIRFSERIRPPDRVLQGRP